MAYTVFHTSQPGCEAYFLEYGKNGWAFEPIHFNGVIYSMVYSTREEAEAAAKSIFCLQKIDE